MTPDQEGDSLAALLRELKERSGQSYGALAKRLHMSTSTLHRYCNGDAVPAEFAPVDRLGRLCGAKQDELVELHRRWIVADAARTARKREGSAASAAAASAAAAAAEARPAAKPAPQEKASEQAAPPPDGPSPTGPSGPSGPARSEPPAQSTQSEQPSRPAQSAQPSRPSPGPESAPPAGGGAGAARRPPLTSTRPGPTAAQAQQAERDRRKKHRRAALVGAAAATALVAVLAMNTSSGVFGGDGSSQDRAAAKDGGADAPGDPSASASGSDKAREKAKGGREDGDAAPGKGGKKGGGGTEEDAPGKGGGADAGSGEAPLSVSLSDSVWDNKNCLQSFLIDREPSQVSQLTNDSTTTWARNYGGVDAKDSNIGAIVQGTGSRKVVLKALRAKVVGRGPALKWNHYDSSRSCGGEGLTPASYDIALDNASPQVRPVPGQHNGSETPAKSFPRTVSANDPEALAIKARTVNCDCRWYLELDWSSGDRSGTVRIDDGGRPFRTSGVTSDAYYTMTTKPPYWVLTRPPGAGSEEQPEAEGR